MTQERIWLSSPHMGGEELPFIEEAFQANWISPVGPHITAFEKELAAYNGIDHVAALSSGTAAIHLALIILGVRTGDEVICQTFTFSGSCNPIAYTGAIPVFVDSEADTWNMDPILLEHAITDRIKKTGKKPKAIIIVHLYGMPSKIADIQSVAKKFEIPIIEDAAEALGSTFEGQKLGTFGDFGIYSFNGNKIITTSGGGALASKSESSIQKARFLATQARDPAPYYQHSQIGYNYRLSNISAAIGRGQMRVLDDRVKSRRANFEFYKDALGSFGPVKFLEEPKGMKSNRWLTTITFESADNQSINPESIRQALERDNIESRPLWKPMHLQPVFSECPAYISGVAQSLFEKGLCLPSGSNLTDSQRTRVAEALRRQVMS
ncbi:MAG TPA: aminotransferase class I/II-fold pyridoxal phosphate-dependent enzyme [Cyclobacteriaceae bacterium]|nr:aminotransferase class I/II-fold pyridoxal phosphate-dependent enzyme [Cyclobacteriaceae bacterium]HMV08955.1 aminotransferase class I/II-fold pyridoxal phosphate-dependent enzyme [Cyclobacteriaceae bacterium]HMV90150.1 aminotransferase class I/II-fold pyridoxal phosphate-dependent enzyme [Cyclobacteriaceae bacterium]HMX00290.1 aminotransferase class I/II-fold pyridoxal phosphate-dependent enzyme [Cyclobacteriaceae bacterium]HMX49711.1 aminotransferase class I/II-fold pyridoxal phosphate-dep